MRAFFARLAVALFPRPEPETPEDAERRRRVEAEWDRIFARRVANARTG